MRGQRSGALFASVGFGEDFVDDVARDYSGQGAEGNMIGEFSGVFRRHSQNDIFGATESLVYSSGDTPKI